MPSRSASGTARLYFDRVEVVGNGTGGSGHGIIMQQVTNPNNTAPVMVLSLTNVLVAANSGVGVFADGNVSEKSTRYDVRLVNCTVADNGQTGVYGISTENSDNTMEVRNSIISGQGGAAIEAEDRSPAGPTLSESFNNFFANKGETLTIIGSAGSANPTLDATDLQVEPRYSGVQPEPYRLVPGSPLLDSGSTLYAPAVDLGGDARPDGAGPSMGAYEQRVAPPSGTLMLLR